MTTLLAAGLLFLVLAGGLIVRGILSLLTKAKNPKGIGQLPKKSREGATISQLGRPDGSQLRVECYGREDAPPIILTHGWGANSTEWDYLKEELSGEFRLIVWDLPGDQPAILLGHSIGGMITLTFCRLFPKALGNRVRAIALVQTTYTNPVRTTNMAGLFTALERPVIIPLLHLTIWLSPLIWLSNLMSYLNGSALLSTKSSGFARHRNVGGIEFRRPLS